MCTLTWLVCRHESRPETHDSVRLKSRRSKFRREPKGAGEDKHSGTGAGVQEPTCRNAQRLAPDRRQVQGNKRERGAEQAFQEISRWIMTGDLLQVRLARPTEERQETAAPSLTPDKRGTQARHRRGGGEGRRWGLLTMADRLSLVTLNGVGTFLPNLL